MKYILLLLISINTFAEIKYERLDASGNSQGHFIVDTHEQAVKRINKMLKVKRSWMKCDWKADAHESNITKTTMFLDGEDEVEVTTYCHPKTFSIVATDVTGELQATRNAEQAEVNERLAVKAMISNINNSDKPQWEKRLLKRLIKEMRE